MAMKASEAEIVGGVDELPCSRNHTAIRDAWVGTWVWRRAARVADVLVSTPCAKGSRTNSPSAHPLPAPHLPLRAAPRTPPASENNRNPANYSVLLFTARPPCFPA